MPSALAALLALVVANQGILEAGGLQRFDQEPEYTEVNAREDAILTCKVFNKRGTCSWQKDNKPVGIYERKYEWAGRRDAGDCSLWVRGATLEFDDGEWECQVTPSDYTTQDALTSAPVRLVVRSAPQVPRIEFNASQILPGHNVTGRSGEVLNVKCVSRYGNPPSKIKWFLGDDEVTGVQSNSTEVDNPRTWAAVSVLELRLRKQHHGSKLRCVAMHGSYATGSADIEVRLDVRYAPEVSLTGTPTSDLEEGRDNVELRCEADANPPAGVAWRRAGQIASLESVLRFRPVRRGDSGVYSCQAQNSVGSSEPLSAQIDVKYPPQIVTVGPDRLTTSPLFSSASFTCLAEGNPPPGVQWLQRVATPGGEVLLRGSLPTLDIANVTYDFQGEYVCKATNVIGGSERSVQSEPIALQVVGAPQVLSGTEVVVVRGQDALLSLVVCADPRPRRAAWEWGSQELPAGALKGRYKADELSEGAREDCYEARLHVREAAPGDQRFYYLAVENDRGRDRHAVHLAVREPVSMATLISIAAACLVLLLVLIFVAVYTARREKCCFARRGDFKPSDLESEKSDAESAPGGRKTPGGGGANDYNSTPRPPPTITGGSPDAMKVRLAAMVLQPPTRV